MYFAQGLVSGPLADRFGARLLAVVGMILTGLGLAVASLARSLPEVYAAYGLGVGLGIPILGACSDGSSDAAVLHLVSR